jgi:hypothetical protein
MRLKLRVEVAGQSQDHAPEKRRATLALRDLTLTFLVEAPSTVHISIKANTRAFSLRW